MTTIEKRAKVERSLGRALSEAELRTAASIDSLSAEQFETLGAIRAVDITAAALYLAAIVPNCGLDVINRFVRDYEPHRKLPPSGLLKLEKLYQGILGRELVPSERTVASSVAALNSSQLAVARALSTKDVLIGLTYLGEVLPSTSGGEREAFATALAAGRA